MSDFSTKLQEAIKAVPEHLELPDDLRVPLHELQADTRSNFGRVAADGSVAGMFADHVLNKLSQVETAAYRMLYAEHNTASTITALQERVKVLEGVLSDLLITAKMLLANSHGCCANHYAEDYAVHGVPGWLLDSEHSINRARTALGEKQ